MNFHDQEIRKELNQLRPWYYLVKVTDDIYTIPKERWNDYRFTITHQHYIVRMIKRLLGYLPWNKTNLSILDYGCNCGWLSFLLANSGFSCVTGYDIYQKYIDQACLLKDYKNIKNVKFDSNIDTLISSKPFDLTVCLGVMNHTENPVGQLQKIAELTSKCLIIDLNCFVPSKENTFSPSPKASHEALLGCNFIPKFDGSDGFNLEIQLSREAVVSLLYRCGFFPVFEISTPLSQPSMHKYYANRFFAIAVKHENKDFWQQELRYRMAYNDQPVEKLVTDEFFII